MATLFVCIWVDAKQVALGDPLQEFPVTIAGTSTKSTTISGSGRKKIRARLFADADCFVTWGEDPTALNNGNDGRPLGAENPEYFDIETGHKIAVIERV